MENYNFWADLLDTYQSSADWIKALWLIVPPAFVLGLVALLLHYRLASRPRPDHHNLISTIHQDDLDRYFVSRANTSLDDEPALPLLKKREISGDGHPYDTQNRCFL